MVDILSSIFENMAAAVSALKEFELVPGVSMFGFLAALIIIGVVVFGLFAVVRQSRSDSWRLK